jgi:ankyrin repeat protein
VQTGNFHIVEMLLNGGANYDCTDKHGRTPMNLAIQRGHGEISKLLTRFDAEKQRKRSSVLASYRGPNNNSNNSNNNNNNNNNK